MRRVLQRAGVAAQGLIERRLGGDAPAPEGNLAPFLLRARPARARQAVDRASRRVAAWSEENPLQLLLAGAALGFAFGLALRDLLRPPRRRPPHWRPPR